jgi:tetratricopeptide (TPR) repeat protein
MKHKGAAILLLSLGLLLVSFSMSHLAVKERRKDLSTNYSLKVDSFSAGLMEVFAGEFKGLLADYLVLEAGAFIGSNQNISQEQWEEVALAFEQALQLDPYFQQTYLLVQGELTWWADMPEKTIALLEISRKHRPWDWYPGYYTGFDYYYFLGNYAKASELFLDTAQIKGAPVLLAVLGGRLALKGGRTEAAIVLLQSMLEDPELHDTERTEIKERMVALRGVLLLENAIKEYKQRRGTHPPSLERLLDEGIVERLPENPYADHYFYNPEEGDVSFDEAG